MRERDWERVILWLGMAAGCGFCAFRIWRSSSMTHNQSVADCAAGAICFSVVALLYLTWRMIVWWTR